MDTPNLFILGKIARDLMVLLKNLILSMVEKNADLVLKLKNEGDIMRKLSSGHKVEEVNKEWLKKVRKYYSPLVYAPGMVRIQPDGYLYPSAAPIYIDKLYNFKFNPEDVLVVTFLKAGTTWVQEIIWTMMFNPNLDNPDANSSLLYRSPEFNIDMFLHGIPLQLTPFNSWRKLFRELCPGRKVEDGLFTQICEKMPGPRLLKSHFPLSLMHPDLLDNTKVVYVARSPKDLMVSLYYFMRKVKGFDFRGTFEEFVQHFMDGNLLFSPYWPHVRDAWQRINHPNLHWIFYEDLKADKMNELLRLDKFLGTGLTSSQLFNVSENTTFSAMSSRGEPIDDDIYFENNNHSNGSAFYRKGEVGDWKNHFTPELSEEVDRWVAKESKAAGITFPSHKPSSYASKFSSNTTYTERLL